MSKVTVGMTMSVDGYVTDRQGSLLPLYTDFATLLASEPLRESIRDTGAVIMGRHAFDMAEDPDSYADDYEYQVPIFVLTLHPPVKHPRESNKVKITFVQEGIIQAIQLASIAAGEKDVTIIGGASTLRQCIQLGLADELHVDIMPILLGGGLRMFDELDLDPLQLERISVVALPAGRTCVKFRFIK